MTVGDGEEGVSLVGGGGWEAWEGRMGGLTTAHLSIITINKPPNQIIDQSSTLRCVKRDASGETHDDGDQTLHHQIRPDLT